MVIHLNLTINMCSIAFQCFLKRHDLARLHWCFFATSHGKGAVYGISGVVKRSVWMEMLSRQVVSSLEDFCQVPKKREEKIEIISFSAQEIQESAIEMGLKDIFSCSTPVFGIKQKHFVAVQDDGTLLCKDYSNQNDESELCEVTSSSINDCSERSDDEWYQEECSKIAPPAAINIGEYVLCQYEGELFPGCVSAVHPDGKGARVMAMEKCTGGWRWPKENDEINYLEQDIIQKIAYPTPLNNRGTYRVPELEKKMGKVNLMMIRKKFLCS